MPDGKVREIEVGTPGGDKITVKCPTSDEVSMRLRGETELKRRTECRAGDTAEIHDPD